MSAFSIFAPAKLNLFLAVTGRRPDGFHELVSLVAPLDLGDTLHVERAAACSLSCDEPGVPLDATNHILRAAAVFNRMRRGAPEVAAKFRLEKRVPMGAGLGGGSSDAVAALRALNRIAGGPLGPDALAAAAAEVGSDCPLFLHDGPVVMRGRGERVEPLPAGLAARLRGRRVLIFKPDFAIPTPWSYARLAAMAGGAAGAAAYEQPAAAEARLASWLEDPRAPIETLLFNSLERPAFSKFVALPVLLSQLRTRFGLVAAMSGSGSACFAFPADDAPLDEIGRFIRAAWGDSAWVMPARLAGGGAG